MNISSADIFNTLGLGMNEIDSFNKTLNEMLTVWNLPIEQTQQPQPQQPIQQTQPQPTHNIQLQQSQQNIHIHNNNSSSNNINAINNALDSILNSTSKGLPRFNLLNSSLNNNNNNNFLTNSNDNLFIDNNNNNNNNNNNIYSNNKSILNNSNIIKTLNEISNEQKSYQQQPQNNNNNNNTIDNNNTTTTTITEFGVINSNSFILDANKIEEARLDTSVLDPFLSLPYSNNTSNTSTSSNLSVSKKDAAIRNTQLFEKQVEPVLSTAFGLNKEELNTFTTNEMNQYVKQANMVKDLSQFEKKELKRQKRLIKNRESAHLSRQRKRERLTDLEHRVEELSTNSVDINKTLTGLENENLILKAEVGQLFEVINDSPVLSALFYKIASLNQNPTPQQKDTIGAY